MADSMDGVEEPFSSCTLLQLYCLTGNYEGAKVILKEGGSPDKTIFKNQTLPIIIAIKSNNKNIVKLLLRNNANLPEDILIRVLRLNNTNDEIDYNEYISILLEHLKHEERPLQIYLTATDEFKRTPLYFAMRIGCPDTILKLLTEGAPFFEQDSLEEDLIEYIDPAILEKYFDSCIEKSSQKCCCNSENSCLKVNYSGLIGRKKPEQGINLESKFFEYLVTIPEFSCLILHPVVLTFLALKWRRVEWLVYVGLGLYIISYISLVIFSIAFANRIQPSTLVLFVPVILLVFRIIAQGLVFRLQYFKRQGTLFDLCLLGGLIYISLANFLPSLKNRNLLVAYSIVLLTSTIGIFTQLKHFSFFSIKVIILEQIAINFFRYMAFYMIPILAFALCFYMLAEVKENEFFPIIFQTLVMFSGDQDKDFPQKFETNPIFGHFIYIVFLVLIVIILHNLLTGLALEDLQKIQQQAQFIDKSERCKYVLNIETFAHGSVFFSEQFRQRLSLRKNDSYEIFLCCHKSRVVRVFRPVEKTHPVTIRDRSLVQLLKKVSKKEFERGKKMEDFYSLKNMHQKIQKLESVFVQQRQVSRKRSTTNF